MQYMVVWSDGNKYGPADLALLNQWASEGRITPDTQLEPVAGGMPIRAAELPGLIIPGASPAAPVSADAIAGSMPVTPNMAVETSSAPHESVISPTNDPSASTTPAAMTPANTAAGQYYVIGPGGAKYGPADVPTLAKWKTENRVNDSTELEEVGTGKRVSASVLLGAGAAPSMAPSTQQMPPTGYQQPGGYAQPGGFSQPGMGQPQPMSPYAQAPQSYDNPEAGKKEFNSSITAAVVGFFCCPVIAPAIGIYYASQAKNLGHKNAQVAMIINIVILVLNVLSTASIFVTRR